MRRGALLGGLLVAVLVLAAVAGMSWLSSTLDGASDSEASRAGDSTAAGSDAAADEYAEFDEETLRFMKALSEPELPIDVRVWVVEQLARERGPQATAILVSILDDPEPSLVLSSLDALADRREDPGVREALERHRSHSDPRVARRVQELLDTTGGSTAPR